MTTPASTMTHEAPTAGHPAAPAAEGLPLVACRLTARARSGFASVRLEQTFRNTSALPLHVTYKLPLPADGAVSGFAFRIGDRRIVGQVDEKRRARARFEQAIVDGHSAALLEEETSSLFTQELGNVPPGADVVAEIVIDQPLAYVSGGWEWRFPLAAAPRYLGNLSPADQARLSFPVTTAAGPQAALALDIEDTLTSGRAPDSPSHALVTTERDGRCSVRFGSDGNVALDRDVVVRWPVARLAPAVALDGVRLPADHRRAGAAFGVLTIVPPAASASVAKVTRDVVLLVDTSGSMSGAPLEQAKRVASAIVMGLGDADSIEIIEFASSTRAFAQLAQMATAGVRQAALAWIGSLTANGGTEMGAAVDHALQTIRAESQRQVILITDGLVGFERAVVKRLCEGLPASCRFHAVGVGESANRSLLAPVARAGRGVEVVLGLRDDVERAVARILANTEAPVVVDVRVEGSGVRASAPSRPRDLYAGAPVHVFVELEPGGGELVVTGRTATGLYAERVRYGALADASPDRSIAKGYAREAVEELEMHGLVGGKVDAAIERIGIDFQISTRLTSWIAITEERTVDPRDPSRRVEVPQALPYGMSAEGLGLRADQDDDAQVLRAPGRRTAPMMPMGAAAPMSPVRDQLFESRSRSAGAPPRPAPPPLMRRGKAGVAPPPPMASYGQAPPPPPRPGAPPSMPPAPRQEMQKEKKREAPVAPAAAAPASGPAPDRDDESEGAVHRLVERDTQGEANKGYVSPPVPTLRGRIVAETDGVIVVELLVETVAIGHVLEGLSITVGGAGRAPATGILDATRTTRAGLMGPGLVLRVAFTLPAGWSADEVTTIAIHGAAFHAIVKR